jgi:O-antigen/teichoic acid export membrane protein
MRDGEQDLAREVAQDAVKFTILLLPFAALIAGSSPAIATLVLGQAFAPAAPFLAILIFAGFARLMVSVSLSILIAAERPGWVLWLTAPVVPLAVAAYVAAILYGGARGAALTTTTLSVLLTFFSLVAVYLAWKVRPSPASMARTALFSAIIYAVALAWPATGIMLLIKLAVIGGIVPVVYYVSGEIGRDEIAMLRSLVRPKAFAADQQPSAARKAVGMGVIERVRG